MKIDSKIDVKFIKTNLCSKINSNNECNVEDNVYKKHIENLVYSYFANIKKIMGVSMSPMYLKFNDDVKLKTIYANLNENRIEWNMEGFHNDILIIMNELNRKNVKITESVFHQIIIIAIAQEVCHLLDEEYSEFCFYEYKTILNLISLYNTRGNLDKQCKRIVESFKDRKVMNEKRAWESAKKYLIDVEKPYVHKLLFRDVEDISIEKYKSLSWREVYAVEFDVAKKILDGDYLPQTINIIIENLRSGDFDGTFSMSKCIKNTKRKNIIDYVKSPIKNLLFANN